MTTLGRPTPPKPASFSPHGAPVGVEIKFVSFWQQRQLFAEPPRSLLAHTNGAENEGSIESASNWAEAKPNSNTVPHYQVGRTHDGVTRARKMLPSNRVGIANATVMPGTTRWSSLTKAQQAEILAHGQIRLWSLAIETADLGWPTPNRPDAPGGTVGFDDGQGELLATIIAYEANVSPNLPLVQLLEWWGAGIGAHTDPDGYPFTTTAPGKPCPGDAKKRDMREWILPRAVEIDTAWSGHPIVIPPTTPIDGTYPPGSKDVMYPIDYGIAGTDSWWTEMAITPKGLQWSGGPSAESQKIRQIFVAVPMPRAPRLQNDADVVNLMETIGTFGDCPSTFLQNPVLREAWAANLNHGR